MGKSSSTTFLKHSFVAYLAFWLESADIWYEGKLPTPIYNRVYVPNYTAGCTTSNSAMLHVLVLPQLKARSKTLFNHLTIKQQCINHQEDLCSKRLNIVKASPFMRHVVENPSVKPL